ncbi:peptide-methionine (R)-S-oxide reductase MsrB [Mucilaginibacter sabulilitoris]|uniref:peptide-methionine (R)-S-oxide reductase n=1 Tax=Mucilaginibacter sabulilitoris TaxID=1173583 RepID=A0ABZ0TZI4_9SPHI|nr:peptide-methionine (R)-S-oxide reductase MsrB [Mucilaginibacter sabulilitoris]WPU96935.1 peptide-methionine (R)-S-oxide reductase MsrB [Mucilaginibacter sabulilitoris]
MLNWNEVIRFANTGNPTPDKRVERPDEEWKQILTSEQFVITRKKGTEASFSGEFCSSYDPGKYHCICCDTPLFDSTIKFNSQTGWPSFTQPVTINAIKYLMDRSYGMTRVETQCNTCDAHLGHVFPDGPHPTGLRYCINSISLKLERNDVKS